MNKILIIISSFFLVGHLAAQTVEDAVRYSYWESTGTARNAAVGGSMGALGGDYSAIISNPASLATYRKSDFTITTGYKNHTVNSTFGGATLDKTTNGLDLNQVGLVLASVDNASNWKSLNFAIGYNRITSLKQKFNYGAKTSGSIANYFRDQAQGLLPSQLSDYDTGLAYDVEAIFLPDTDQATIYSSGLGSNVLLNKSQDIDNKGGMSEWNLSLGANYKHKLYLGASLDFMYFKFNQTKIFTETDDDNSVDQFDELKFQENLATSGSGSTLKLGVIYRASQAFRIGAAVRTPLSMKLTDTYSASMNFKYDENDFESSSPQEGRYEYELTSPVRLTGHVAGLIGKKAFLTGEVEWINYKKNAFNFNINNDATADDLAYEQSLNGSIENTLQSNINLRFGGEVVVAKNIRVRAGYALLGSPYKDAEDKFGSKQLSLGLGYRLEDIFIDLAYVNRKGTASSSPYYSGPVASHDIKTNYFTLTLGLKI